MIIPYPLDEFYKMDNEPVPHFERVDGDEVPEPQNSLLVHHDDMTPTLQLFYQHPINLSLKKKVLRDNYLLRKVVLTANNDLPVLFGAIRINLEYYPQAAQEQILACQRPLGEILEVNHIPHTSAPRAFFRVNADYKTRQALMIDGTPMLFGRVNQLVHENGNILVKVVEILPPKR